MNTELRRKYDPQFKTQVVLEVLRNSGSIREVADVYGLKPALVRLWKQKALNGLPRIFSGEKERMLREFMHVQAEMNKQISELKIELEIMKRKSRH